MTKGINIEIKFMKNGKVKEDSMSIFLKIFIEKEKPKDTWIVSGKVQKFY